MAFIKYRVRVGKRRPKSDCERCAEEGIVNNLGARASCFDAGEIETEVVEENRVRLSDVIEEGEGSRVEDSDFGIVDVSASVDRAGVGRVSDSKGVSGDFSMSPL